jgi:hypothetical protein
VKRFMPIFPSSFLKMKEPFEGAFEEPPVSVLGERRVSRLDGIVSPFERPLVEQLFEEPLFLYLLKPSQSFGQLFEELFFLYPLKPSFGQLSDEPLRPFASPFLARSPFVSVLQRSPVFLAESPVQAYWSG